MDEPKKPGFLKMPTTNMKLKNIMCCCQPNRNHDESLKFVLFGEEENKSKPIFDKESMKKGMLSKVNFN